MMRDQLDGELRDLRTRVDTLRLSATSTDQRAFADQFLALLRRAEALLPRIAEQVVGPPTDDASRPRATILVVEDERLIRISLRHELQALGYEVAIAADAGEALPVVNNPGEIDLLLSDVLLPGMSGPELAREVRKARPGCKLLFMSALPADVLVQQGRIEQDQPLLQKPFSENELAAKVREILGARAVRVA